MMLDLHKLIKVCTVKRFSPQEIIFEEGNIGTEMYIILSGTVRVLTTAPNGNQVEVTRLISGDTFGEMALIGGFPRTATVQALEETTTAAVNESNFESVICQEPSLALRVMKALSERLRRQNYELAKYKDQISLISRPINNESPVNDLLFEDNSQPITEIKNVDELVSISEFSNLIKHIRKYDTMAPSIYNDYLFEKRIVCPVCGQTIKVKDIRSSKLKLIRIEPDFRQIYSDFDPLWYKVWVCPNCYYSNFDTDFLLITEKEQKRIKELSRQAMDTFGTYQDRSLSLIQAFTGYYLMLYLFQHSKTYSLDLEKIGRIWLRLSWLFHDIQELELSIAASKKALEYYLNLLNDITVRTTAKQDQYLFLLVGELYLKIEDIAEARKYFRQSLTFKGGDERMKQQAQDRIQELKDSKK